MKGKLIVLESCDGGGKSTQIKIIQDYLIQKGLKSTYIHFPMYGHNEFSTVIAKFLRGDFGGIDDVDPYFAANIYAMDRFLYLPKLLQKLEDNDVVLLDRYVFSNIAFQGAKLNDGGKIQDWIDSFEFGFLGLPYPDLTLFLDVPISIVEERLHDREGEDREYLKGKQDIHEADMSFQAVVRNIYLSLENVKNYHIIKCWGDVLLQGPGGIGRRMYSTEELFDKYKSLIKNVTNGI